MAAPEKAKMFLFAYTVKDYEKTAAFYKEALGVEFPEAKLHVCFVYLTVFSVVKTGDTQQLYASAKLISESLNHFE